MKRRKFVQNSVIISAALSSTTMSFCASKNKLSRPLNKKSLKYGMIQEDLSVLDKFKLIKTLGFDGVEMDSPHELDDKEVIEARDKANIIIPGVVNSKHWKKPLSDPDPTVREECTASMIDAFYQCKKFGGTTVLLVPAVVNDEVRYDEAWERSTAEIKKMLPIARETGVKIAIENVWNNFLISPMEAARYIDQFDSDMIGWYMDIGNIVRYGWPHHWIRILGKRIIKVDIKDYSRTKQSEEGIWKGFKVKLGEGDADWAKVNLALKDVGYSGWGSAEV
ncbi:MAG: sugar phosphate isomerase/epimerase family protein, partial [Saprospiraceae bacterium]